MNTPSEQPQTTAAPLPVRRPALAFIFVTVMLDVLALGMIIPVLAPLVVSFAGGSTAQGARIYGIFGTVWAVMQFLSSPVLGALSDRFGRRPVILLSNFGLGLDYILMALAPSLSWLFVGRVISGITAASFGTAGAYIADVMPPEKRAAGFGMLGAAFGFGFVLGPALGGLCGAVDPRLPFWVAAGMSLLNAMYGLFVLPESLSAAHRAAFSWRRANPLGALILLRSQPQLAGLAVVSFLGNLAHVVLPSTFVLYAGYRYHWGERAVGLSLAAAGVCAVVVQAGLVRRIVPRLGERTTLLLGLAFGAGGFAVYGFATSSAVFLAGIFISSLWGLAGPTTQALMTQRVGTSEQGRLQGATSSINSVAQMFGPGLFTLTFAHFIAPGNAWHLPGAPFLLAALLTAAALAVAWRVTHPAR